METTAGLNNGGKSPHLDGKSPSVGASSNRLQQKILEKQKELKSLQVINNLINRLLLNFERLSGDLSKLSSGTDAIAMIMSNWSEILKIIKLSNLNLALQTQRAAGESLSNTTLDFEKFENDKDPDDMPLPETLVRLRLNKDVENNKEEEEEDTGLDKHEDGVMED
ncbi:hypothetical protein PACTADRAFT_47981 [Pachysolen tannophilus NRRL Y-2460]|uniref:DASH complex subunit DAD2 n=1 Tax=Pachysolen tannophilus NRRL Y-2460 TaxID=669874 RepID=A0A1E4U2F8_PACTA|nr:hypothetical protein PACTADRAFT_47981 [Pachysolen tannophilus NRRL Y-2460]